MRPESCLGAPVASDHDTAAADWQKVDSPEGCDADNGYTGRLCHTCLPGYGRSGSAGCSECPDPVLNVVLMLALKKGFLR